MRFIRQSPDRSILSACFLLLFGLTAYADDGPGDPPRVGVFKTTFAERSPLSDPDAMAKITHWRRDSMPAYDVSDHDFQLVVPEGYDGSEAYGLLVFIHPNNKVSLERFYGRRIKELLAERRLIWVSYSDAGNPVMPNIRMGLALDAVHNVSKAYRIDKKRVYVSGMSGGGRMTCMSAVYYPQVFTGAVPLVGTLYFRDVKLPDDPAQLALIRGPRRGEGGVWPRGLWEPKRSTLKEMKANQRWVLLAGEKDYNMPEMRAHYEQGFRRDQFEHAHYLEVPGMGHTYPDAEWYGKALALLDKPLEEKADLPPADERTQRLARKRLEVALRTLGRDRDRGIRALEKLIEDLPNTEAAEQARAALEEALRASP